MSERIWRYVGCWAAGQDYESDDGHTIPAERVRALMQRAAEERGWSDLVWLDKEQTRTLEHEVLLQIDREIDARAAEAKT